jgi:hypothetical protein
MANALVVRRARKHRRLRTETSCADPSLPDLYLTVDSKPKAALEYEAGKAEVYGGSGPLDHFCHTPFTRLGHWPVSSITTGLRIACAILPRRQMLARLRMNGRRLLRASAAARIWSIILGL